MTSCGSGDIILDGRNAEIGRGAFGTTFRVRNTRNGRLYAAKKIYLCVASQKGIGIDKLCREVDVLRELNHPNIVKFVDSFFSNSNKKFNIIMELITGKNVTYMIEDNSVSINDIVKWWSQIASALCYLHERNYLHRDIKPSNIMIDELGNAILIDFGLSRLFESSLLDKPSSGIGTSNYASYEKLFGLPYDGRDDVFATGCVIVELMMKARLPTNGGPIGYSHIVSHCNNLRLSLIEDCKKIDRACGNIIEKMLEPQQCNRCTSKGLLQLLSFIYNSENPSLLQVSAEVGKLFAAIKFNDRLEISRLVLAGTDLNTPDENGEYTIFIAAMFSSDETFSHLISLGADVNTISNNRTILMFTCCEQKLNMVDHLVEADANLFLVNSDGNTALHIAASAGYFEVIRVMLTKSWTMRQSHSELMNLMNNDGYTAVMSAAVNNHKKCVDYLICAGSKAPDGFLYERMMKCEKKATVEVVQRTSSSEPSKTPPPPPTEAIVTPPSVELVIHEMLSRDVTQLLYHCCKHGMIERVKYLLTDYNSKHRVNMKIEDRSYVLVKEKMTEVITYETPLYVACYYGHTEVVKFLLQFTDAPIVTGIDSINELVQKNPNAMITDSNSDYYSDFEIQETIRLISRLKGDMSLLKSGADPNILARNGWSCLFIAAKKGFYDIVKLLIVAGADVKMKNKNDMTPLNIAAYGGHLEIVKVLVAMGADVNQGDKMGARPLHAAIQSGKLEVVRFLLDSGADINGATKTDITPLYVASYSGYDDIVALFLETLRKPGRFPNGKQLDLDFMNKEGLTPIVVAAFNGRTNIVTMLIAAGASLTVTGGKKVTALYAACQNGHLDVVKLLIKENVDVNLVIGNKNTPAHAAAIENRVEVLRVLKEHGAIFNSQNVDGVTPLYMTCEKGHKESLAFLIDVCKVNVNTSNKHTVSPMNIAAQNGHTEVVVKLIENGGNINSQSEDGPTPLFIASQNGNTEIVKVLLAHNAQVELLTKEKESAIFVAGYFGHIDIVKMLISAKASLDLIDRDGRTPLWWACKAGKTEVVKLYLENKANHAIPDREDVTPLAIAAQQGYKDVCEALSLVKAQPILCSVCLSNPRSVMILPCRHLACCSDCNIKMARNGEKVCPICRETVFEVIVGYSGLNSLIFA